MGMDTQRQQQRRTLVAAAVLLPLVAACGGEQAGAGRGSGSAEAAPPLTGVRWNVDSVTADGTTHRAPPGVHMSVDDRGRAEGSYGCNRFRGDVAFEGDRIRLRADTTLKACAAPRMDFERTLSRTLTGGALTTRVDDDRLTLTADDGTTVRLSRAGDEPLHGTRWTVDLPEADGRAHLTFDEKGTVSGSLGCNDVNADATVRDGHITLGAPAMTRMMCEDSLMDAERTLLRLFDGTVAYRIDPGNLTLTSENGTRVTAFAAE
ncbi:META domain-containing protein [Streptomyces viridosporus]|uniref:META domain-containing protein n=1 Tax=Streptomyces TaxID=1883 RepID=UPI000D6804BF|nr:META domain-containing protein [Streptomyces sp. NWU49]PWJ06835.1 META domain-containing protein [Streptomyces sp. NWU49]